MDGSWAPHVGPWAYSPWIRWGWQDYQGNRVAERASGHVGATDEFQGK